MKRFMIIFFSWMLSIHSVNSQIMYQEVTNKDVAIGSYGRIGVDWNFENEGSIGRRLNLNNMGSIGGRMEEQDYLELATALGFKPVIAGDSTLIYFQLRMAVFSRSLSLFGNSTSSSLGGLTFSLPEMYALAKNILGMPLTFWIGARLYRGEDVHIADHFYFNDHSGQGFGIEYNKTRFSMILVSSTDTTSTLPPYFYLNTATGTPSLELRARSVFNIEQDLVLNQYNTLTFLGEYHRLQDASQQAPTDSIDIILNYPSDYGWVLGIRNRTTLKGYLPGSFNNLAIRYGAGIANGGDGGVSRTYLTFGAPNLEDQNFRNAYSLSIVDHFLLNFNQAFSLNGYLIYTQSRGAAETDGIAESYFGREVFNRKEDLTLGFRGVHYFSNWFHLLSEIHYSQRKDGTEPTYSMVKFGMAPTFVPTGERSAWARPHFRFVFSLARYNDAAMKNLYSPYLSFIGEKRWGYYMGIKAEWWIWN